MAVTAHNTRVSSALSYGILIVASALGNTWFCQQVVTLASPTIIAGKRETRDRKGNVNVGCR